MLTDQNIDKPKRQQTKTSTQAEMSTIRNVDEPKRPQTETSIDRNIDTPV